MQEQSWLADAQALPLDGSKRVRHDCGSGRDMVISHSDAGWRAYCHRCGPVGFVPRPSESLAERLARIKAREQVEATASSSIVPPMPPVADVTKWPDAARVWLYQAGLSNADIKLLGIYYHEKTDRIVIPILSEGYSGDLVYWQARAYDWKPGSQRPKYLNPASSSASYGVRFLSAQPQLHVETNRGRVPLPPVQQELHGAGANTALDSLRSRGGEAAVQSGDDEACEVAEESEAHGVHRGTACGDTQAQAITGPQDTPSMGTGIHRRDADFLVLTEDYLSAYRIHTAGYDTLSLLGTKLGDRICAWIGQQNYRKIVVWLDNDLGRGVRGNPGQIAAAKICKQLRSLGLSVVNVVAERDPKKYSRKEIQCHLTSQLYR